MKAIWNGYILAESNDTIVIENNHYFPHRSLKTEFFRKSEAIRYVRGKAWHFTMIL